LSELMGKWIPLSAAEAKLRLITSPGQRRKNPVIIVEMAPLNHTGPEPGIIYRLVVPWQHLVTFGKALNTSIKEAIEGGVDRVPGTDYSPVKWELADKSHMRLVMTAGDCETIAHAIASVAAYATQK